MIKQGKKHIKIGDRVKIITGVHKDLIGNILAINIKQSTVFVDNILPRIKYAKNPQGGEATKSELQIPIHISNVMLWDKEANVSSKIGYKLVNGEKKRYFKKSGNLL
jgi:large subunit ribosomal protein L24